MKTISKLMEAGRRKILAACGLVIAVCLVSCEPAMAQPLPGAPAGSPTTLGSFISYSNTVSFVSNNIVVSVTNADIGLTNWLIGAQTSSTLFSTWFNPTGTNGFFVGGTNYGMIPLAPSRFITLRFSGYNYSNGVSAGVSTVTLTTNVVTFASSDLAGPQNPFQYSTSPLYTVQFTATNGFFFWTTNIEEDALGSIVMTSWTQSCTNTSFGITNPVAAWHTQ